MTIIKSHSRRKLVKSIGATTIWVAPVIQVVNIPVHAQTSGTGCGGVVVPGIKIKVRNANTNANISCVATGTVSENGYSEVLQQSGCSSPTSLDLHSLIGAIERAGVYNAEVAAPGYISSTANNLVVTQGVCNVNTVSIDVALTPV